MYGFHIDPLTLMPTATSFGPCSTSVVITFDQKHSRSAGGNDPTNDTQMGVIGLTEPGTCTKKLSNLRENHIAKISATTHGYPKTKIACLDDAFVEFFELEASPVEGQSLQQKDKGRKKERPKKMKEKT